MGDDFNALADEWEKAGIIAAKGATYTAPWYKTCRADLAHAANCFVVAAGIRAALSQQENG